LLEDRFQLKIHRETKELPIYELAIAKSGSKMKLSENQTPPERGAPPPPPLKQGDPMPRFSIRAGRGYLVAVAMGMPDIVRAISEQVGRVVVDRTGLQGLYDVKMEFTPEGLATAGPAGPEAAPPIDPSGSSYFTTIQEQLGLKLESKKGPVEAIVIDSVQKPTEN
jgi:uncharacterized protein (TIGR03435 family)